MKTVRNINKQKYLKNKIKAYPGSGKYKSWRGNTVYRTNGDLGFYFYMCNKLGLKPTAIDYPYSFSARGNNGFNFDYCEHDILLAVPKRKKSKKRGKQLWDFLEKKKRNLLKQCL